LRKIKGNNTEEDESDEISGDAVGSRSKDQRGASKPQKAEEVDDDLTERGSESSKFTTLEDLNLAGIDLDDGMMHLVQTAFCSLGNFFALVSNKPASSSSTSTLYSQFAAVQKQPQLPRQQGKLDFSAPVDADSVGFASSKTHSASFNGSIGPNSNTLKEISEFESELARNLVTFQDKLLRTKMRLDVMELVQVHSMPLCVIYQLTLC
jgi:hypothetical protein